MNTVWVIKMRLHSGAQMLFSQYKKTFALVPVGEDGVVKSANCWATHQEAEGYLKDFLKLNPKVKSMGPFEIVQVIGTVTNRGNRGHTARKVTG